VEGKRFNIKNGNLDIFTQLGLTIRQAQVYLAIAQLGSRHSVKAIEKRVPADRAEIYRTIIKLEKLGLVQRYITRPATFRAVLINEAFSILLQQQAEKYNQIQIKSEAFMKAFRGQTCGEEEKEDSSFNLTVGLTVEHRQIVKDIAKIQTSSDAILSWGASLRALNDNFEQLKEALQRGVKMRRITSIPKNMEIPSVVKTLKETGNFKIKFAPTISKAGIGIYDQKSISIITFPSGDLDEIQVLRSRNLGLVELAQDYFDMKWQIATTPRWHKNKTKLKQTSQATGAI
jgi:sugar-specific transcriptional regulator TrmB